MIAISANLCGPNPITAAIWYGVAIQPPAHVEAEDTLFALARIGGRPTWVDVPPPPLGPRDVRIRVRIVGLCRTDLAVARGELVVNEPRILGHEFSGEVVDVGEDVQGVTVGDHVAANPVIACEVCSRCSAGFHEACLRRQFLGVDRDGAIAETIVIPGRNVWVMPMGMDNRAAAMLEPVAACAAVTKAPIQPRERGLVFGRGRLATLTELILRAEGFQHLDVVSAGPTEWVAQPVDTYDFAIDTEGTNTAIENLAHVVHPGGKLIVKSRPTRPVPIDFAKLLQKELSIHFTQYASFAKARRLLVDGRIDVTELFGPTWSGREFSDAFEAAKDDELTKHFIAGPVNQTAQDSATGSRHSGVWNRCVSG